MSVLQLKIASVSRGKKIFNELKQVIFAVWCTLKTWLSHALLQPESTYLNMSCIDQEKTK